MAHDLFSTLRTYASKVSGGEKTPAEVSAALAAWAKESGEGIKEKVESEIESALLKMGFVKKEELTKLEKRLADLESKKSNTSTPVSQTKSRVKKSTAPSKTTKPVKAKSSKSSASKSRGK